MKKVVITGVGGFIGRNLCELLLSKEIQVIGVDISEDCFDGFTDNALFTPVIADFGKYSNLSDIIVDRDIDVFYHFAWNGTFGAPFKDAKLQLDNSKYAVAAMDQAITMNCQKFVFAGTCNEYEAQTIACKDEYNARYTNVYGTSKLAADLILRAKASLEGIEYCSGLIAIVYGNGMNSNNLVNIVMRNFKSGVASKLIEGNNEYDLIHVSDVAKAFFVIGEKGKNMIRYYVGHKKVKTFKENITAMRDILSSESELLFGEYKEVQYLDYSIIDTYKLYNDTGFECEADFAETMKEAFHYL